MSTKALKKIIAARVDLICDQPFFGALALSLTLKEDVTCQTAWVDGRDFGYNPAFIESLPHSELCGLVAHEIMHCAMGHPWRKDGRDHKLFNEACDIAINGDLKDCFDADTRSSGRVRFAVPKDALFPDTDQRGKSAEWIYARLPQPKPDPNGKQSGQGNGTPQLGKGKPDPAGEVRDAPTGQDENGTPAPTEGEWKQRTAEALQAAKMAGNLPAGLSRMVESALDKRIDVRSLLLRFMVERTRADFNWNMPSRRYAHLGLYLPALESIAMGEVAIMVDTSGSVNSVTLQYVRGILQDVLDEVNPAGMTVYFVDTKIQGTQRMERGEPLVWEPKGGGGTCFLSFFEEMERGDTQPVCIIALSDLYATFPISCYIPTIWLTDGDKTAPFGETINIDQ